VNPELSEEELEALLDVLVRGLCSIRRAAGMGKAREARAIAEALHNVPAVLKKGSHFSLAYVRERLAALSEVYPEQAAIARPLGRLG
jgi:hypothetical protein